MNRWLQGFAYRTTLSAGVFAAAAGVAIGIAILTISVRAAAANPAESLRFE